MIAVLALEVFTTLPSALAAGTFDPSFGTDGTFVNPLGEGTRPGARVNAIALQPDGKIVVTGEASQSKVVVARLDPEGALDQSFGVAGRLLTTLLAGANDGPFLRRLVLQPDGKIVVCGMMGNFVTQENRFLVARVTAEGELDSSFDGDGVVQTQLGVGLNPFSSLSALALQSDGKILVGGGARDGSGDAALLLARLLATDGSFDSSFGTGGKVTPQLGNGANPGSTATVLVLQPDGKILVGGAATDTDDPQLNAVLLTRLDADGKSIDPAFGDAGKVVTRLGVLTPVIFTLKALALQPDRRIVIGGSALDELNHQKLFVARLNADAKGLDPTFANGGSLILQLGQGGNPLSEFGGLALQPDGKIVVVGQANGSGGNAEIVVARLGTDGTFDSSFGESGKVITQLAPFFSYLSALALQPDGKMVAGGGAVDFTPDEHALVVRLILDEPPSVSFTAVPNPVEENQPVAFADSGSVDPDGTILSHTWDFGDGATADGASTSHGYASVGTYTAMLTVRDDYGLTATSSQAITVNAPPSCGTERVPRSIKKGLKRASGSIDRAAATEKASRRARLLARAQKRLGKVSRAIDHAEKRRRRPLSATCAAALRREVQAAEARITALGG